MALPLCRPRAVAVSQTLRRLLSTGPPRQSSGSGSVSVSESQSVSGSESQSTAVAATNCASEDDVVIFSAIQPTGVPHLGNYLGAMRHWRELQEDGGTAGRTRRLLFAIADLHAITLPQDAAALRHRCRETLASLLAIGLDPDKSTLFCQSSVPAHSELMWILSCTASTGYLNRMTQWKAKLSADNDASFEDESIRSKLKLGLFSYPVLQAADILVHGATHVPVGEDQKQHLEFARECATNFNHTYGGTLTPPQTITTPGSRIMSLANPLKKMSKSAPNHRSRIVITADPDEIRRRFNHVVTDMSNAVSYDPIYRPAVANVLEIYSQCHPERRPPRDLAYELVGATLGDLKRLTADAVIAEVDGVKDRYFELLDRKGGKYLDELLAEGADKARLNTAETMRMVREAVGLAD